jgi:hypothetical protein
MKLQAYLLEMTGLRRSQARCSICATSSPDGGLRGTEGMICLACSILGELGIASSTSSQSLRPARSPRQVPKAPAFRHRPV